MSEVRNEKVKNEKESGRQRPVRAPFFICMTNFKGGYITKEDVADTIILYLLV